MGTSLHNPNDQFVGRDGGPYLDEVQALEAEKRRAAVEGRKPDVKNPGADAGIPLMRAAEILGNNGLASHPSREHTLNSAADAIFDAKSADKAAGDTNLVKGEINDTAVKRANAAVEKKRQEKEDEGSGTLDDSENLFDLRDRLNTEQTEKPDEEAKQKAAAALAAAGLDPNLGK